MTSQEIILWGQLRGRRFEGFKFRREMWLGGFIADFACPGARLVVEADGSQHADDADYDEARGIAFERLSWRTLRFWNNEITENLDGVLLAIRAALPPLPAGEREGPVRCSEAEADGRLRGRSSPGQPLTRLAFGEAPSPLKGEG